MLNHQLFPEEYHHTLNQLLLPHTVEARPTSPRPPAMAELNQSPHQLQEPAMEEL